MKITPKHRLIKFAVLSFLLLLIIVFVVIFFRMKRGMEGEFNAIWNNHCENLRQLGIEWKNKGRPTGDELVSFVVNNGDQKFVVEDKTLTVGTNNIYVIFSRREECFGFPSKLFLCTNDVIIAESATGLRTIIKRFANGKGWEPKPSAIKH